MRPIRVTPIYNKTIWAGNRLANLRGREDAGEGTSWEISVHPFAQSVISEGEYAGRTLASLIEEHHDAVLGRDIDDQDLLRCAFLDAKESLSVQVHPGEVYAMAHEKDHGKTESWYILDADPGAELVAGSDFQNADEIRSALNDGTIGDHLYRIPVQEGDFILVPSGTLHALGAGILALEIGTNSNTTYRFYDYGRTDASGKTRELHIDKSIDVVRFGQKGTVVHNPPDQGAITKRLADFPAYSVDLIDVNGDYTLDAHPETFRTLSCVKGSALLEAEEGSMELAYTESVFLPAACGSLTIHGTCRLLVGTPHPHRLMEIKEPACTAAFEQVRPEFCAETGTKKLMDISGLYQDTAGVDPETVLYDVKVISGDRSMPGALSYGLTTIYPVSINGECPFTKGHWHCDETYDEVYMGESGSGLLMYMDHDGATWCEKVFPGSVHHIKGIYAHRLINTGEEVMKVRAVWSPHAGHNYDAVAEQPFGFRVFRKNGTVEVIPHE